jgi:heme A synthase
MRAELARHFDVVVVVWMLALFVSWSVITLSRAPLSNAQWDQGPQAGAVWVVPAGAPGN